jgi:DNA polymerase elongation subunit (family B)
MKNLIVATMFLLTSLITFSQFKYPLSKYGLKSNIWEAEPYDYDKNLTSFGPKGGVVFSYDELVKELIKTAQYSYETTYCHYFDSGDSELYKNIFINKLTDQELKVERDSEVNMIRISWL